MVDNGNLINMVKSPLSTGSVTLQNHLHMFLFSIFSVRQLKYYTESVMIYPMAQVIVPVVRLNAELCS